MAKKFLGQHFLTDPNILGRIADGLPAAPGDAVLEIGPGRGALTAALVARGFRVTAIEKDRDLIPDLRARFPSARIVEGDALEVDWHQAMGVGAADAWFVIGNIPYNVTSPLIDRALEAPVPRSVVFLVQKEVAVRLAAPPGAKDYGALTVGVARVARVERLFNVPAGAFQPPPKVASSLIRLTPNAEVLGADRAGFRRLVVGLFGGRRKQLVRALRTVLSIDPVTAAGLVAEAGLNPTQRPETLSVADFVRLYQAVVDGRAGGGLGL